MPLLPLAKQSKPGSAAYSGERLLNYYARPSDAVAPLALVCRWGLVEHVHLSDAPVRAVIVMGGNIYAVCDGIVWRISGGVASNVGTVNDGPTSVAANSTQIGIVVGGEYFVCNGSSTARYATGAVTDQTGVAMLNGLMVVSGASGGRRDAITVSALRDATTFNALDFAFAEADADDIVGIIQDHNEIWTFGERTTQVWYNTGAADFPLAPNVASLVEQGCGNGQTIAKADNATYWVRPDSAVLRSLGASPEVISTPEVQSALSTSTISGAFSFSENGHEFYAVTRDGGTTLVFDIRTGLWHERTSGVSGAAWVATCRADLGGVQYLGTSDGRIAIATADTYADFGQVLLAEAETPIVENAGDYFVMSRLHLMIDGGLVDIGRIPQAMLQTSRDGRTWGSERWRNLASYGAYGRRAVWHNLGAFRVGKLRLRVTDPVPRDISGVSVEYG